MTSQEQFLLYGAVPCKDVISLDLARFMTHVLLRKEAIWGVHGDAQVPGSRAIIDHDLTLETIHEKLWPMVEEVVGDELLPTYAYSRLYGNGNVLEKHTDRPACEVSVTVQLGRSHHYSWPIYMGNFRFDMAEGSGIVYKGCDVAHWRDKCDGPPEYYSGQAFFHFVRKNGKHADQAGDSENRQVAPGTYVKHRGHEMGDK